MVFVRSGDASEHLSLEASAPFHETARDGQTDHPQGEVKIADGKAPADTHGVGILPAGMGGALVPLPACLIGALHVLVQIGDVPFLKGILHGQRGLAQTFEPPRKGAEPGRGGHELIKILPVRAAHGVGYGLGIRARLIRCLMLIWLLVFLFHKHTPKIMVSGVVCVGFFCGMQGGFVKIFLNRIDNQMNL